MNEAPSDFPISSQDLQASLPHRAPMVWIDFVDRANQNEGLCRAILKKTGPQCSPNGLRQSSLIEWLAQGAGFTFAALAHSSPQTAYLVSVSKFEYCDEQTWDQFQQKLESSESLPITIHIKLMRAHGAITLFSGEIYENSICLGQGTFKTFSD